MAHRGKYMLDQEPSSLSHIQDIPRIKSLVEQVRLFKLFKQAFPLLKPVLKLLGISTGQIEEALAEVDILEKKVTLLATLPDRFNRLFASRGWIAYDMFNVDIAQAAVKAPPDQPSPTWRDTLRTIQDNAKLQSQLKAWCPRSLEVGVDIPASDDPEAYEHGGPEQKLIEYLSYWRKRNYGEMAHCLAISTLRLHKSINVLAGELREHYEPRILQSFTLLEVHDPAPAVTTIQVELTCENYGQISEYSVEYRLLFESERGRTLVRGASEGRWGVIGLYLV